MSNEQLRRNGTAVYQGEVIPRFDPPVVKESSQEISEATTEVRNIVQNATKALQETLQQVSSMTDGRNFRMTITEEISIIERD